MKAGPVKVQQVTYSIQAVGSLEADDMIQVTAELDGHGLGDALTMGAVNRAGSISMLP